MPPLQLAPPDWDKIVGDGLEAAWIADRDRKFGLLTEAAVAIRQTAATLRERDALFHCSSDVLAAIPAAADWYVSLAGFALKTLEKIRVGPRNFGLTRTADGLVNALREGRLVTPADLEAFSRWINAEIERLFPQDSRDESLALATVLMIRGGRVIGQGQNLGGNEAVVLVKSQLVEVMAKRRPVDVEQDGVWVKYGPEHNLPQCQRLRYSRRLVCEFVPGGDRPDLSVSLDGEVIAVGEIKGRKDLANVWESWMPQVAAHMRTWRGAYPDAARLFFGTLITEQMVAGQSARGTLREGLRGLYEDGLLTTLYNVSKIAQNDPGAVQRFEELIDGFDSLLDAQDSTS